MSIYFKGNEPISLIVKAAGVPGKFRDEDAEQLLEEMDGTKIALPETLATFFQERATESKAEYVLQTFIIRCLAPDPAQRPTDDELPAILECSVTSDPSQ